MEKAKLKNIYRKMLRIVRGTKTITKDKRVLNCISNLEECVLDVLYLIEVNNERDNRPN